MKMNSRTIDGIPMRWKEHGEGIPLVLVHGIPTGPDLWRHVLPKIEGARCLAWEMVGYAGSIAAGRERNISVAQQAAYLLAFMDALGLDNAVLAGHDLGGGVAQIAAVRERDRFAGLFLTNAICYDSWPIPSVKAMQATKGLVRHLPDAALKLMMKMLLQRGHDTTEHAKEALETHFPFYANSDGAAAMARQVAALDVRDTEAVAPDLPGLKLPARLAWGAADAFQKLHYGERLAKDLDAPLRRIDGGKHFTPEDHPDVIAEEINLLLNDVRSAGRAHGAPANQGKGQAG
ncbi:alpha/beta fold hydrolase [Pseudohoeflea coraliihabitans]|uniref:Alpha/beta hydrolase n=1 Tax=Pseudohoeflea coraliihabitans TaxID=2860393 RepID=A0ABS6WP33_9HYPH|nr:alpha/beta hydrolase [Pseudohoeflea sp. DP4N28-3]MBW3097717.1 alpha/beta hydrolase [Pseudohoeflea sp. DP4N28-3]